MSSNKCPEKSIALWPYTTAIPAGWSVVAAMVGRYLQGGAAGYTGPANGGSATHGHTYADHAHTGDLHYHSITSSVHFTATSLKTGAAGPNDMCRETKTVKHSHADTTPGSQFTYGNSTATVASGAADPLYVKAVPIEPDDNAQDIPVNALVMFDTATPASGFEIADGTGGRPDLDGRFILACDSGVGNGGGDLGGSTTHTHTVTHGTLHTVTTPDHVAMVPKLGVQTLMGMAGGTIEWLLDAGHHDVPAMTHGAESISAADNLTTDAASNDPAYLELLAAINENAAPDTPVGVILASYADVAAMKDGWALCDGSGGTPDCMDRQIKLTTGSPGGTGGDNDHDHGWTHGHTHTASHGHTVDPFAVTYVGYQAKVTTSEASANKVILPVSHFHSAWSVNVQTPTLQDAVLTSSTDDIRGLYRTCVFIKKITEVAVRTIMPGPELRSGRVTVARG